MPDARASRAQPASRKSRGKPARTIWCCVYFRRRIRSAAASRASRHARRETGGHAAAAPLRREYSRDQLRPQTHFSRQGRRTGAAGLSGHGFDTDSVRRDRGRSGCDRLRPDGAGPHDFRRREGGLDKYGIWDKAPPGVRERLQRGNMRNTQTGRSGLRQGPEPDRRKQPTGRGCRGAPGRALGFRTLVLSTQRRAKRARWRASTQRWRKKSAPPGVP